MPWKPREKMDVMVRKYRVAINLKGVTELGNEGICQDRRKFSISGDLATGSWGVTS